MVLTHANVLATVTALQKHVKLANLAIHSDDCVLSYLTLAHIFGRCVEEFVLSLGARIGYWQARSAHACTGLCSLGTPVCLCGCGLCGA